MAEWTYLGWTRKKPTYTISVVGDVLRIDATAAPVSDKTRYLLGHQGALQLATEAGTQWFDQTVVADANATLDAQKKPTLQLRLNPEGTARLGRLSSTGLPVVLDLKLDGETLTRARLSAPITEGRLEVTIDRPLSELQLLTTVLRSGPLSFKPVGVNVTETPKP